MSANAPGALRAALPKEAPLKPEAFDAIFSDLDELIIPGLSHWQSPKFFGYFPANSELSSVLGDYLSTGLGALGLSWQAGPALTELEEVVVDWMRQLVGLSDALERRHRGHGVDQHDGRPDLRARANQRIRARARRPAGERGAADRLRLRAFAFFGRQGRAARRLRPRQPSPDPVRPGLCDAPGRAGGRDPGGHRGGAETLRGRGDLGHHGDHRARPDRGDRGGREAARPLAARRRGDGRLGDDPTGMPVDVARRRGGGFLGVQPAQMARRRVRLLALLRPRSPASRSAS